MRMVGAHVLVRPLVTRAEMLKRGIDTTAHERANDHKGYVVQIGDAVEEFGHRLPGLEGLEAGDLIVWKHDSMRSTVVEVVIDGEELLVVGVTDIVMVLDEVRV